MLIDEIARVEGSFAVRGQSDPGTKMREPCVIQAFLNQCFKQPGELSASYRAMLHDNVAAILNVSYLYTWPKVYILASRSGSSNCPQPLYWTGSVFCTPLGVYAVNSRVRLMHLSLE